MKIQKLGVEDLTEDQAKELHALFSSGDGEKIAAKLQEFGVELPDGDVEGVAVLEKQEAPRPRRKPVPEHVVVIANGLAQAKEFDLLTEFLDVNVRLACGRDVAPERLVKLMERLLVQAAKQAAEA